MITWRAEKREDQSGIYEVHTLAFKQEEEAKLVNAIRLSDEYIPELSLVAEVDGHIVGHVMFSKIYIEMEQGMITTLGLAPVAVRPDHQGKGIGSALIQEGLKRSKELGYPHVVVLGHADYYPRFGFVPSVTKGIQSPFPVPAEAFMVLELIPGALQGIEGVVKYPPTFDQV